MTDKDTLAVRLSLPTPEGEVTFTLTEDVADILYDAVMLIKHRREDEKRAQYAALQMIKRELKGA